MTNEPIRDLIIIIIIIDIDRLQFHHQDRRRNDHWIRKLIDLPLPIFVILQNVMILVRILLEIIIQDRNLRRLVIIHITIVVVIIQIFLVHLAFLLPRIRMIRQSIVKHPKTIKIEYLID